MEPYIKDNVNDITYPERSYSSKNNFGIPKRHKNILLHSGYVRTFPRRFASQSEAGGIKFAYASQ